MADGERAFKFRGSSLVVPRESFLPLVSRSVYAYQKNPPQINTHPHLPAALQKAPKRWRSGANNKFRIFVCLNSPGQPPGIFLGPMGCLFTQAAS